MFKFHFHYKHYEYKKAEFKGRSFKVKTEVETFPNLFELNFKIGFSKETVANIKILKESLCKSFAQFNHRHLDKV